MNEKTSPKEKRKKDSYLGRH